MDLATLSLHLILFSDQGVTKLQPCPPKHAILQTLLLSSSSLPPCTDILCKIVLASLMIRDTCPNHLNLRFFTVVNMLSQGPMACLVLSLTASLVMWCLNEMPSSVLKHLISVASSFFRMSAVNVQVSLAYNSTQIIRERTSLIFEQREVCLFFQMVFSMQSFQYCCCLYNSGQYFRFGTLVCDDCAQILKTVNLVQFSSIQPVLLVVSLVFSALISMSKAEDRGLTQAIHRRGQYLLFSCQRKLVIVLSPMLMDAYCSFMIFQCVSHISLQKDVEKSW